MLKKGNKLYSIWNMKCPRCHKGNLFDSKMGLFEMPDRCPSCNQNYMPEPGFYYGAMFISYIFTAWFCIFFAIFFHWILDWSLNATFAFLIFVLAILFVWIFRMARSIWINMTIPFDPKIKTTKVA